MGAVVSRSTSHASASQVVDANLTLAEVQQILLTKDKPFREAIYQNVLLPNKSMQTAFFRSFETGYHLPANMLSELLPYKLTNRVPDNWYDTKFFNDDDVFIPERFYLVCFNVIMRVGGTGIKYRDDRVWLAQVIAQAKRLLAAGTVDVNYLRGTGMLPRIGRGVSASRFTDFRQELQVYLPEGAREARERIRMYTAFPGYESDKSTLHTIDKLRDELAAVELERERLFHDVWLPSILSASEWAMVRHAQPSMLRELYPDLWAAGYDAYHQTVLRRTRVNDTAATIANVTTGGA